MSVEFIVLIMIMLLVAVGLIILPLLKKSKSHEIRYLDSNVRIHEQKLLELKNDYNEGRITKEYFESASEELDKELLINSVAESEITITKNQSTKKLTTVFVVVFLPMLAIIMYVQLGASNLEQEQLDKQAVQDVPLDQLVKRLQAHIDINGGTAEEWVLLARAYKQTGNFQESINAFIKATELNSNAQFMLEHAEAIALKNNKQFTSEALDLILNALKLEPENINALWFAGVAEFQNNHYEKSVNYFSRLYTITYQDKETVQSIKLYVNMAKTELLKENQSATLVDELLRDIEVNSVRVSSGVSIEVNVDISQEARNRFKTSDQVYVYAKATNGPKMPLAVKRINIANLPATVILDDSMAMTEAMNLSAFNDVIVSARVSKSGSAITQSGDYIGFIENVNPEKSATINILIDTLVQ